MQIFAHAIPANPFYHTFNRLIKSIRPASLKKSKKIFKKIFKSVMKVDLGMHLQYYSLFQHICVETTTTTGCFAFALKNYHHVHCISDPC